MSKKTLFSMIALMLLLYSCSSISEDTAKYRAISFVKENVKFYTKEMASNVAIPEPTVTVLSIEKSNGKWEISMHAFAQYLNETKQSNITLKIDSNGNVEEFNGNKVR